MSLCRKMSDPCRNRHLQDYFTLDSFKLYLHRFHCYYEFKLSQDRIIHCSISTFRIVQARCRFDSTSSRVAHKSYLDIGVFCGIISNIVCFWKRFRLQEREQYESKFDRCQRIQRQYWNPKMSMRRMHLKESERQLYYPLGEKVASVGETIEAGNIG